MNHLEKPLSFICVSVLFCLGFWLLTSCSNSAPYRLGFIGGLTGRTAELGVAGRDGVILAVEDINRQGGISGRLVELIIKDDKEDRETAVQAFRDLKKAGAAGVIGPMTSSMALSVQPVAAELDIVMISPTASTNELSGKDDHFFRVHPANALNAEALAKLAYLDRGYRRISVIYDLSNRNYSENLYRYFEDFFREFGGSVIQAISYTTRDDTDFGLLAGQLSESSPDGVFVIAGPGDSAKICRQLARMGVRIPVLASEWAAAPDFLGLGGGAVEGVEFFQSYDRNSTVPAYMEFREKFNNRFHQEPGMASIRAYEAARVMLVALEKADTIPELAQTIISTGRFEGLQSDIVFDDYGDVRRPFILRTVKNGLFITVSQ